MTATTNRAIALVIGLALIATACSDESEDGKGVAAAIAAVEANEAANYEAWMAQDLDALMEVYADDVLFVDETFGDYMEGKAVVRSMLVNMFSVTDPDGIELLDRFVSEDGTRAASQWEWGGTNFAGKEFDLPYVLIHEYRDGKIVKETIYYASPNAYEQLLGF
jgi:steroid delta-isomerase-like uncharacterized protein